MIESVSADAAASGFGPSTTGTGTAHAGELLREAREAQGLHVAALAVALKVPARQIEALESDRLEQLPDVVFARALAASVCRQLRIDPQPVLARLPQGKPRLNKDREPINEPFRSHGQSGGGAWREWLGRPPVLVALVLLLGAVILLALPLLPVGGGGRDAALPAPAPAQAPAAAAAAVPAQPGLVTESVQPALPAAPAAEGNPSVAPLLPAGPAASR